MRLPIFAIFVLSVLLSAAASASDDNSVLELTKDYTISVTINGQPFKLRVDPYIGDNRILNADTAQKLKLKGSMIGGLHMIGPVRIMAQSNVLNTDFGSIKDKKRVFWLRDRAASLQADGLISPAATPYKIVRYRVNAAHGPERIFSLPLNRNGKNAELLVNGNVIALGFDLNRDETLVSASTGLLLTNEYKGGFIEEAKSTKIRFEVERPTRLIKLDTAIKIGGLPLDTMMVRVSDFGDATQIKDAKNTDNDELVVSAASKQKPKHVMIIGRGFLSRCSTLTYDFNLHQIQMSCAL